MGPPVAMFIFTLTLWMATEIYPRPFEEKSKIIVRVVMIGPADPVTLADLLNVPLNKVPKGMGGTPVNELTRELLRRGHQVRLVTASPEVTHPWEGSGPGFSIYVAPYRRSVRQRVLGGFKREIDAMASAIPPANEYDVLHAHWTYEFAAAALSRNANSLVTAHDSPWTVLRSYRHPYRLFRLGMAWGVARRVRFLCVVSPYLAQRWKRQMFFTRDIAIIPNIAPLPPLGMHPAPIDDSFISIGDGGRNKNIVTLLKAFEILRHHSPDATLELIGPGLGESDPLGMEWGGSVAGVTFRGRLDREDLWRSLMVSSVLVHPSLEECQPMALLEGMRAGIPVVAGWRSGGVAWTLADGAAGTLTDVRDPVALARAMISASRNLDHRKLNTATSLLETRYSHAAVASAYESEYAAIMRRQENSYEAGPSGA
jgi:L-malate glycosyltransferase